LKEEALDRTKWRNRFGRGCGPVVWQITDDDDDDDDDARDFEPVQTFHRREQSLDRARIRTPDLPASIRATIPSAQSWLQVVYRVDVNFEHSAV
jgi:hypothetical protein